MIKFNFLIHKETGTVIDYEEWERGYKYKSDFRFADKYNILDEKAYFKAKIYVYKPKEMLFDDDFEIIYDSEFTTEESDIIFKGEQKLYDKLQEKVKNLLYERYMLKMKYWDDLK